MSHRVVQNILLPSFLPGALPLRAFNRLLRAVRSKYLGQTYFGTNMELELGDFVQSTIYHFGSWEPGISRLVPKLVRDNSLFIDIGANVGYYSLLAAKSALSVTAVAIEPSPRILPLLRRNVALNPGCKIYIVEAAVGPEEGTIPLFGGPRDNLGRTSIRRDSGFAQIAEVKVRPLRSIVSKDQRRSVSLIKIDVEGAELPIIEEIVEELATFPPDLSVLVEHSATKSSRWVKAFDAFVEAGFKAYFVSNDYAWEQHEAGWKIEPQPISALPDHHCDLLFTSVSVLGAD